MGSRLDKLPRTDPETGDLLAVVETPRGSRNKYAYDPELRAIRLKKVLPIGSIFPFDFGFLPQTKAGDGDPLDVMILMDESTPAGCAIAVRVIGAIEAEQRKTGQEWVRNDRLLAVSVHAHQHADIRTLEALDARLLDELEAFFKHYTCLESTELRILGRVGADKAAKLIEKAAL